MYSVPPTPPASSRGSCQSTLKQPREPHKCVVLTSITKFLPSHILQVLLSKEYTVRGVFTALDEEEMSDIGLESLFDIHPQARKFLFIQRVLPVDQRDWERVLESATHVIHVVVPLAYTKIHQKSHDDVQAAAELTRCLLRACVKVKTVQRIILITSIASVAWSKQKTSNKHVFNEEDWEIEKNLSGYAKCQLVCEKAAWDFIHCLPESDKVELVVLNPALMLGPIIRGRSTTTIDIIKGIMEDSFRWLPCASIPLIDVRDVAQAAAVALVNREAAGHRHILYCASIWLEDIVQILRDEFIRQGYNVMPAFSASEKVGCTRCFKQKLPPNLAVVEDLIKTLIHYDNTRMRTVLNVDPHFPEETIIETAYSLIFWELIERKSRVGPVRRVNASEMSM